MSKRLDYNDYTVAWIAVLPIEAEAALGVLDKRHEGHFESLSTDDYIYIGGEINNHNVVIATYPDGQDYGPSSAAALANQIKTRFPRLWISLLVGVAAGLPNLTPEDPSKYRDIRLGDVLVSIPDQRSTGIFHYDLGKATAEGFLHVGRQAETAAIVRSAIANIRHTKEHPFKKGSQFAAYLAEFQRSKENDKFFCPSQEQDRLYGNHAETSLPLQPVLIERPPRDESERTLVWYGTIGSGGTLMKNAAQRDLLRDRHDLIGLEMEAAGIMNTLAPGVIRGVCDYGDAQKKKDWQPYAAAVAAVYAKGILYTITPKIDFASTTSPSTGRVPQRKPLCLIPFERKDELVGRASQLDHLAQLLFPQGRHGKVAITGLGGVGKSRLALEMAYWTTEHRPSCSVFWIQGTDSSSFERDCRQVGQELKIPQFSDPKEDVKRLLQQHFNSERTNEWLLIIDNADDMGLWTSPTACAGSPTTPLMDYIPRTSSGAILLTTRNHQVAVRMAQKNVVELQELKEHDALTMMKSLLIHPGILDEDPSRTCLLLEHLACLPLAIVQVAAYLNENQIQDIDSYLRLWDLTEEATVELLSEEFKDEYRYRESKNPVAATWLISFEQMKKQNSMAADLLAFLACMDFKSIPESLFPFEMFETDVKDNRMTKGIAVLTGYAFLRIQEGSKDDPLYDMHRLVHLATRNWLRQQNSLASWMRKVALHIWEMCPEVDLRTKDIWERYLPHAEKICISPELEDDEGHFELLRFIGQCHEENGKYGKAADALQKVVSWRTEHFSPEDVETLTICGELGECLELMGSYSEAETFNQRAVDGLTKVLGIEDGKTLVSMSRLASTFRTRGRLEEAEALGEQILAIRKTTLGDEHRETLAAINNLALTYGFRGRYDKMEELQKEALDAARRIFGEKDIVTNPLMRNLASTYIGNGRSKDAEELLLSVLEAQRKILEEEHPDILDTMTGLASVYQDQGRLKDSEELYLKVAVVRRKILGDEHRLTLLSLSNLALVCVSQGRLDDAEKLELRVLEVARRILGEEHPDTMTILHNVAGTYWKQGRLEEAKDMLLKLLATRKRILGEDHPETLDSTAILAGIYEQLGCLEKAVSLGEECLRLRRQKLGHDHPDTLVTMHNLASTYDNLGCLEKAVSLREECLRLQRQKLGVDHPDTLTSMHTLALLWDKTGHLEDAVGLMSECVEIEGQKHGDGVHGNRVDSMIELAILLDKAARREEAITVMEECLNISLETKGEYHPLTINAREWLAHWAEGEQEEKDEEKEAVSDNNILQMAHEEVVRKPSDDPSTRKRFKYAISKALRTTLPTRKKK